MTNECKIKWCHAAEHTSVEEYCRICGTSVVMATPHYIVDRGKDMWVLVCHDCVVQVALAGQLP